MGWPAGGDAHERSVATSRLQVGLAVDLDDCLANSMAVRVAKAELLRRLPGAQVVILTPRDPVGPTDGGEQVSVVGDWTPQRRAQLAAQLDALGVIAADAAGWPPADGLGAEHEASCPSVSLDPGSLCLLAPGVLCSESLDRRLAWLRLMGWYPKAGRTVLVDSAGLDEHRLSEALTAFVALAASRGDLSVVVFGDGVAGWDGTDGVVVLPQTLSLEDLAAVHRNASVVVGAAFAGDLALAYGRCFVSVCPEHGGGPERRQDAAAEVAEVLDGHAPGADTAEVEARRHWAGVVLDALASTASRGRPAAACAGGDRLGQLAQLARERQLTRQRLLLGDHDILVEEASARLERHRADLAGMVAYRGEVEARLAQLRRDASDGYARWEADLTAQRSHLGAERDEARAALADAELGRAEVERELVATRATRLFRSAAAPRGIYGALIRRRA